MRNDTIRTRQTWQAATIAIFSGLAVLATATAALAHDDEHGWKNRRRHFVPPGHVYYYGPPVYYAPRPVVVYPAPIYYEPAPVYYPPSLNLNFNIPLR